jgi:dihydroorotase/N-acyl-D-amino-acid deacylase
MRPHFFLSKEIVEMNLLRCVTVLFSVALAFASVVHGAEQAETVFSVILEGGNVYDGTGAEPVVADVGIMGDRIAAVGDLKGRRAGQRIDVRGLAVVPGFIDTHSHGTGGVFRHPLAENYTRQGVTTFLGGPDGSSPYPIAEFLARFDATPSAVNLALTVGHGTIRRAVLENEDRDPTPEELERMKQMVDQAMKEGAFGLSTGLKYVPGAYSKTEEVIALAAVAGRYGGIHISHIREEGLELVESVQECIRIGEEGGLPTQITHHKVVGATMWGSSKKTLALVDEARARGVDVTMDQYPYTASSTSLSILFPAWCLEGDREARLARLKDPEQRARIKEGVIRNIKLDRGGGDPANVVVSRCSWDSSLNGKNLAEILELQGRPVSIEEAAELALELQEKGGVGSIFHAMKEEDVQRIMQHPYTMTSSDGGIVAPGEGVPHPRNYAAFARVLGHYARDLGVLTFPDAVRKMSGLPAQRLGLKDRGVIREGAFADMAVLKVDEIRDRAEFGNPHQYATGTVHVFVNGVAVILEGEVTGARPGRALRH